MYVCSFIIAPPRLFPLACVGVANKQGFKSPLSQQARSVEDGYGMYQYYLKVKEGRKEWGYG